MREPAFLKRNQARWKEYEKKINEGKERNSPDELADMYIQLTDDLAYARTFYKSSIVIKYLNGLAARLHLSIFKRKKVRKIRLWTFWTEELPGIYRNSLSPLFFSSIVFIISFAIGMLSSIKDPSFVVMILGRNYVNMTIENIESGNPFGVYESMDSLPMFLYIAFNNIKVSFTVFVFGIFLSVGTIWLLFTNGVMVGAFLGFFLTRNLLGEAIPVIFIHGTLELSAIVIAGAAGLKLGNAILFPGTFPRLVKVRTAASQGLKMVIGLMPVFLLAALLESYVTRLTEMPLLLKISIILISLIFVIGYYLVFPHWDTIKRFLRYGVSSS